MESLNDFIGSKIKEARKKRGVSQEKLSEMVGLTNPQMISLYETGKSSPGIAMLNKIAEALDHEITFFISKNPPKPSNKPLRPYLPVTMGKVLAKNIKTRRQALGLTVQALADQVGLSLSGLTRAEAAERVPRAETIEQIAHALNCKVYELFKEDDADERLLNERIQAQEKQIEKQKHIIEAFTEIATSPLLSAYMSASEQDRQVALALLTGDEKHLAKLEGVFAGAAQELFSQLKKS